MCGQLSRSICIEIGEEGIGDLTGSKVLKCQFDIHIYKFVINNLKIFVVFKIKI